MLKKESRASMLVFSGSSDDVAAFHMRRAYWEFRRHFSSIQMRSLPLRPVPVGWRGLVPNGYSLQHRTLFLQEWAGIA